MLHPATGKHPLVAFSVGLGVIRANYTSIAEELASHGYIIAMVEGPLQGLMLRPDGRAVLDSAGRYGEPPTHRTGVAAWARDISFVLDRLETAKASSPAGRVAGAIERSQIGALGHSTGGLVAIAACEADPRVRACANLDGGVASPDREPLARFRGARNHQAHALPPEPTALRRHNPRAEGHDARTMGQAG
jgi:predicted dienelactone hydrolase